MDIRKMNASQMRQSLELDQFAFQFEFSKEEKKNHERMMKPENTWIAEENGQLLSKLTILPVNVFVGRASLPMGGISSVATWPESRRGGLVRKLLDAALLDMRERGYVLSFLYPFSIGFYRKFGWELFADTVTWEIKKEQLPKKGEITNGAIRRIPPAQWPVLQDIYQAFAYQFNGMVNRTESWWRYTVLKQKKGQIAVYTDEEGIDKGYLIYKVKERYMTIHEFIAIDENARAQLWSFIANHDSMIEGAKIMTTTEDPTRFMLPDPMIKETRDSYFMARIVDMKAFLEQYPFQLEYGEELTIETTDNNCSWNNGVFFLKKGERGMEVTERPNITEAKITMDINTVTAVLLGYISVETGIATNKIKATEQDKEKLKRVIVKEKPFIYDFF
ncbi:GNAT family N-acetyltransferase [Salibacterium salarium]|uniref:GNAT family N-acetyltransferase n=1 Tax=Salibacterium salarium TaxID=284579 RepID=A0A428MY94_9BACI|nr:GNAT family N-acetyltransferase [Salibacterium salarium]RSL31111.1 GNAT family N-acetyltransferase [Salibacterium salarium]